VDSIRIPKNTTINSYKYPLKNQEDEVIIQLDKINQNQFFTYKRNGINRFIYQNFSMLTSFINKPLLVNSKRSNQPLSRFNLSSFQKIFRIFKNF
jgi:hypothetical protein